MRGALSHHSRLSRTPTSLGSCACSDNHSPLSPSKSEAPSVGQQMVLLKPTLSWSKVAKCPSAGSRCWAAPSTQPRTLNPAGLRELPQRPGMRQGLPPSNPGCPCLSAHRLPWAPSLPRFWNLYDGYIPTPSFSQACCEVSPHPVSLTAANRGINTHVLWSQCHPNEQHPEVVRRQSPVVTGLFGKQG